MKKTIMVSRTQTDTHVRLLRILSDKPGVQNNMNQANTYFCDKIPTKHNGVSEKPHRKNGLFTIICQITPAKYKKFIPECLTTLAAMKYLFPNQLEIILHTCVIPAYPGTIGIFHQAQSRLLVENYFSRA